MKNIINDAHDKTLPSDGAYRVLLASDIHCTHLLEWYGVSCRDRMQMWVDAVLYEHEQKPFDLIIIMGDVSLDFWLYNGGGSYLKEGISTTETFVKEYVSQLPGDLPIFIMAGNHEQYGNEKWKELTGNERRGSYMLGDNLFIMSDTFGGELDPDYNHDGVYTGVDMDYVNAKIEENNAKNVWLVAHYFDMNAESDGFKALLSKNMSVKGLFHGHLHRTDVVELGDVYNDLTVAQTGNFSYTKAPDPHSTFWGFRELVITKERAISRYIIANSDAVIEGKQTHLDRTTVDEITYNL